MQYEPAKVANKATEQLVDCYMFGCYINVTISSVNRYDVLN